MVDSDSKVDSSPQTKTGIWTSDLKYTLPAKVKKSVFNPVGIELAPVRLPFERRMQTLAIIVWFFCFFIMTLGGPFFLLYITFFTSYGYLFTLPYLFWMWYDRNCCNVGGRTIPWCRNWTVWQYYKNYFPVKLIKTADLDPRKNYLFGSHPHGILCTGAFSCFGTAAHEVDKVFPGLSFHILTLEMNFRFPLARDLLLGMGVCAASRAGMNHLLSTPGGGKAAVLIPGGAPESLDSHPGSYVCQLKKRKGFIKVALQNGSDLVPCISFGETDIYEQVENPHGSFVREIQDRLQQIFQIAPVPFFGRGVFQYNYGMLPKRKPITVVVGAPISVEKKATPSQKDIDDLHQQYVDALINLFYTHRDKYAGDQNEVIVIT